MILFLRFLPFLVAVLEVVTFFEQAQHPLQYPWIVALGVLALPVAAAALAWGRVRFWDLVEKMTPSFVLVASLAFALLLAENQFSIGIIIALAAVSSFISLELFFLYAFGSSRYPVSGLSRVNIAYVPIAVWYAASTSTGLIAFLHTDRLWHIGLMIALGAMLFRTTGHPGASWQQNTLWSSIGAVVGAHAGLLGAFLPLSLPMQGMIAAFLISASLRARRYKHDPKPSMRQAWAEASLAAVAFIAVLSTATWL